MNWRDIFKDQLDQPNESGSDDDRSQDEDYPEMVIDQLIDNVVEERNISIESDACCFYLDKDDNGFKEKILGLMSIWDIGKEVGCLANEISNVCESILHVSNEKGIPNVRYALVDNFLRQRHEILHNLSMRSLRLDTKKTDEKFCDVIPELLSERTPDRIILKNNHVIVIETTATLNVYRSFISKGKIEEGFKSKYESEINALLDLGYDVDYFVLVFDVKNPNNADYMTELKKIADLISVDLVESDLNKVDQIRCVFCNYSDIITKTYSNEITNLMSESFALEKPLLKNVDFLLSDGPSKLKCYKRIPVSMAVFNKLNTVWPRLPMMLSRIFPDYDGKISPVLDHTRGKFTFIKSSSGMRFDDLMKLINDGDKAGFSKLLIQMLDGRLYSDDKADLEFFDTIEKEYQQDLPDSNFKQYKHLSSKVSTKMFGVGDYEHLISVDMYKNIHHAYEDNSYEDKLIDGLDTYYKSIQTNEEADIFFGNLEHRPFVTEKLNESIIIKAVKDYDEKLLEFNSTNNISVVRYQKQPFLYNLIDINGTEYQSYKSVPNLAISVLKKMKLGPYTKAILDGLSSINFVWGSNSAEPTTEVKNIHEEIKKLNSELYKKQMDEMRKHNFKRVPKLKDIIDDDGLKEKLSNANKRLSNLKGGSNTDPKKLSIIKIPCKGKNSIMKKNFNDEMTHFKNKKQSSTFKGVGILDHDKLFAGFKSLLLNLKASVGKPCPDNFIDEYVSKDANLLHILKNDYMGNFKDRINFLKMTGLYHSCAFVSRLCHSLIFHSQTSMSCDYLAIDNLGYDGVILIVRGGKKIFKTKQTKLFRLLYPIHDSIKEWYDDPYFKNSVTTIVHKNQPYLFTSWHCMDEVIVNDGLTFLHKTMSYLILSHEMDISLAYDKCFFNIMLSFHNRRKTEELIHNVRYICVNSISLYSRLDLMLPELANFNYDYFQSFLRTSLSKNFKEFSLKLLHYNSLKKVPTNFFKTIDLKSPFSLAPIENLEDLTVTIYSTFLMSKSPTNQALEQAKNLRNMLKTAKIHKEQSSDVVEEKYQKNGVIFDGDISSYWEKLNESDFNYDPTYCNLLGKFSADYLSNIVGKNEINDKWHRIVNENWDNFANTKGLRAMNDEHFFNKKGYFIVYDSILKNEETYNEVKKVLLSDWDDFKKRKHLMSLNKTYKQRIGCKKMEFAIFHVVDKKQRGGSREIFVMDLETKINQQAIEKFMNYICKLIPNEAISVPSNKRLQHIHSNVFEKFKSNDLQDYYLTLDCRKWAPHSVISKFIDMIIGMKDFLPNTFVTHFIIFFSKMFNKKVYTREYVYNILENNAGVKDLLNEFLKRDEPKKGYYMEMSYSWVMGIFNYMSSFMHVMNQLHVAHLIMKVTTRNNYEAVYYHMNAHSDDSGGKVQCSSELELRKTFFIYEMMLKSCNHMLSNKKCNISNRYFEFLSVLYISNTLLSLIAKLSGAFVFHPTDTGYSGDINECYSKCIELISSGATFQQAYVAMKIMAHLVYKFYFNKDPIPADYNVPPQLLGFPDSHPLIVLISGSDSDIIRLTYNNEDNFNKFVFLSNLLSKNSDLEAGIIRGIKTSPNIRISQDLKKHKDMMEISNFDDKLLWVIKNFDLRNTGMQLLKYRTMLDDKKFVASLIDETVTRRISRAYFFRNADSIDTPWGLKKFKVVKNAIRLIFSEITADEFVEDFGADIKKVRDDMLEYCSLRKTDFAFYDIMNSEVYALMSSLNNITYSENDIIDYKKTVKPIHINMQKTVMPTAKDFSPVNLCIWMKMTDYRWMIGLGGDYKNSEIQVSTFLERYGVDVNEVDINWLYNFLMKMKSKYVKEYFIYSNLPHDFRDISNYQDLLGFLAHNSFKGKFIQGITMPLGSRVSQPLSVVFKDIMNDELEKDLTFINYCFSITQNFKLFSEVANLKLNGEILGFKGLIKVYEALKELSKKWEMSFEYQELICPHIQSLIKFMDCELYSAPWLNDTFYYSFLKSQKLVGNVWLGKGLLYINLPKLRMELVLTNVKITQISVNKNKHVFSQMEIGYINSVLMNANLGRLEDYFSRIDHSKWPLTSIGMNQTGLVSIDKNRNLKTSFGDFVYKRSIRNKATDPGESEVHLQRNFSYKIIKKSEGLEDEICTLNVLKIETKNMMELLMKLYTNKFNLELIETKGEYFNQYMRMFVGEISDINLRVDVNTLFDLFQSSKIYSMMSKLVEKDLLSKNVLKPRKHIYPGQEGGLLSALIEYKKINQDFLFEYDNIITPELMTLKSTQPHAFMSNLITKFKEKYCSLYSGIDKDSIKRDLMKLADIFDSKIYQNKILSLLTTWGYIGVMGALDEMQFIKKAENFSGIRLHDDNNAYLKLNIESLENFVCSLTNAVKKHNYFNTLIDVDFMLLCKSYKDFQKTIISYIHSATVSCYDSVSENLVIYPNLELIKLSNTLKILLSDELFCEEFSSGLQEDAMLMLIPISADYHKEIIVLMETLLNSYYKFNKNKEKLDYVKVVEHRHELEQPYVKTKNVLEKSKCNFKTALAKHHGVVPNDFFKRIVIHKFVKYMDKVYDFNFTKAELSDLSIPFNKEFLVKNKFKDDLEDIEEMDEYYDLMMELECAEPDIETIDEIMETLLAEDYRRKYRLRYKGEMLFLPHFDVKYILIPELRSNISKLNYLRNAGTTLLLVTNVYIPDLVECLDDNVQIFKPLSNLWENKSLLDPDCMLYYVIDYHNIDVEVWKLALVAELVDKHSLKLEKDNSVTNMYVNQNGSLTLIDKYNDLETKLQILKNNEKIISKEEKTEEEQNFEVVEDQQIKKLKDEGFDDDFIEEIKLKLKKFEKRSWSDVLQEMIKGLINNRKLMDDLKKKTKAVTEDILGELKDVNQATKIFEVATIFGEQPKSMSEIRNRSLQDSGMRAEIDSFSPNLSNIILSGRLSISSNSKRIFIKHCKAMRKFAMSDKKDREKKLFFIDFASLVLNDAYDEDDGEKNNDDVFEKLKNIMTDKIVSDDEDDDYDFRETYSKQSGVGKIYYTW